MPKDDTLFRELCRPDTLKLGWHMAHLDSRDDFVNDAASYEDFALQLNQHLDHLLVEIKTRRYRPRYLTEVEVPKDGLSVRPGNVLPIEEAVVLNAITCLLAPKLDKELCKEVHSYRLHENWRKRIKKSKSWFNNSDLEIPFLKNRTIRKLSPFTSWYDAWPEFDRVRVEAAREKGYKFVTRTDIVSYFENIDLGILEAQLRSLLPKQNAIVELLMRILHSWTRETSTGTTVGRGIPQGNDVSAFLANLYLIPLDDALSDFCQKHKAVWFRYVDDVEVYSKEYSSARDVVLVINDELRSLHLNLQGSKTKIESGQELEDSLSAVEIDTINAVIEELQKCKSHQSVESKKLDNTLAELTPIAQPFSSSLPQSVRNLTKIQSRTLRRLMTAYGMAGREDLREVAIEALREPPELRMLQKALKYLQQLPVTNHEEIADELVRWVERGLFPLPYHNAAVIETIKWLHPSNGGKGIGGRIVKSVLKNKGNWLVIQKGAEALLSLPYREDHVFANAQKLLSNEHPFVRRAAVMLLTRGPKQKVRNTIASLVYHPDPSINRLALMWASILKDDSSTFKKYDVLGRGFRNANEFVVKIPHLWLIRCSQDKSVVSRLRQELKRYTNSLGNKVDWHITQLLSKTNWVEDYT